MVSPILDPDLSSGMYIPDCYLDKRAITSSRQQTAGSCAPIVVCFGFVSVEDSVEALSSSHVGFGEGRCTDTYAVVDSAFVLRLCTKYLSSETIIAML